MEGGSSLDPGVQGVVSAASVPGVTGTGFGETLRGRDEAVAHCGDEPSGSWALHPAHAVGWGLSVLPFCWRVACLGWAGSTQAP